ncbi:MAG: glycogen/starch synthase [Victivallales bacterium]|nr:glycogen/starch synthase [Victivallales bacterium]
MQFRKMPLRRDDSRGKRMKVLIVTPEITYVPQGMGNIALHLSAKAGGLGDVSASLVSALFEMGADVHIALPHYRRMFHTEITDLLDAKLKRYFEAFHSHGRDNVARIHLAEDRAFYYRESVYSKSSEDSLRMSLTFQREVINHIIPELHPDLIHCNDWMTGLIPAFARRVGIPSLFTVHNIHTQKTTLEQIENFGIDTAMFWEDLYFERQPYNYEETRSNNAVDLLTSGIFSAHFINTVSPTFLKEIVERRHGFVPPQIQEQMANKFHAGCAVGILNAPDPDYAPEHDKYLVEKYTAENFMTAKRQNKVALQEALGLKIDPDAPLFFWPSRLDPIQKGPQLLTDILYNVIHDYWESGLQLAIVADGAYQQYFVDIMRQHGFYERMAVHGFNERLSHLAYAASDFLLMPSRFEPCGLPQMIGPLYGTLPLVHDTGGLHDTVEHLDVGADFGNGFVFRFYDSQGLRWAFDEAMRFYHQPQDVRIRNIVRIMNDAKARFNHDVTANSYIKLYEQMLQRPLIPGKADNKD